MKERPPELSPESFQPFAPLPSARRNLPPPPPPFRPRRRRSRSPLAGLMLFLSIAAAVVGLAFTGYEFYLSDHIIPGVTVLGQDVGGMTRAQAAAQLQARFGDPSQILARFGGGQIVLREAGKVWRAWPWELGFRTDWQPALDAAYTIGHRDNLALSLLDQARALVGGVDVPARADFDETTARAYLSSIAPQLDLPARQAELRMEGLQAVEIPAQKGRRLDADETLRRIQARLFDANAGEVELAMQETDPPAVETQTARTQIQNFLRAPLLLTFQDREWAIDQATLAALISIRPVSSADGSTKLVVSLDHAALVAKVTALAREVNQAPRDARFHFDNGTLTPIVTSQEGRTLDVNGTVSLVEQKLNASSAQTRVPGAASPSLATPLEALRENSVALDVQVQKPAVDMRDADKMGIKELVAQGVSNFKHSIPGRIQNIKTATASFDGVVIPPGGVFSFDKYLIDVVEANGYEDAYVIFGNRTVLGPGGGVCQVSTTAFRAAFWGGFPIVERWAHAYRVGYYEPPVGLDATVFAPDVDFKFQNDTGAYLLIEPVVDEKNTTLTFNFYGTKPNREVKLVGPDVTNVKPHAPAIYNDDPTLAKGVVKQVDFAVDGEDVTLYREIYVNGDLVKREKFFSRYAPWQAVYQVGTREQ